MCNCHVPEPRRFSRRDALLGIAAGVGALAICGISEPVAHAQTGSGTLNEPGSALVPARRMGRRRREFDTPPAGMLIFPVEQKPNLYVLDNFGDCRSGGSRAHAGTDIMVTGGGNEVYAVANGVVTQRHLDSGSSSGSGWGWTIKDAQTGVLYRYFHLAADALGWAVGQPVRIGDVLGFVGSSGTDSPTNFHLHFEVRPDNVPVDPLPLLYYDRAKVATAPTKLNACLGRPTV